MHRKSSFLFLIAVVFVLTGSSCSKDDTSLVVDFINVWMQSRGIVDENGKPTGSTIRYVASGGWVSSGDPTNDAIIGAGQVIKNIKEADEKAVLAQEALGKNPPDRATALTNLTEAVDKRPKDWYLRSQKGVLLLEMGQTVAAGQYLNTNNASCNLNNNPNMTVAERERCFKQIQSEANLMAGSNNRTSRDGGKPPCDLLKNQANANAALANLASSLQYPAGGIEGYRQRSQSFSQNSNCQ